MNFVVVEFGDNDFGTDLLFALRNLIDDAGGVDFCPTIAKEYITEHVVSAKRRRNILKGWPQSDCREYLSSMHVTFRDKLPTTTPDGDNTVCSDGGSVYYDVNLDKVMFL